MNIFDLIRPGDLERRELHLTLVACSAIVVLAGGLAVFMFPVVFSGQPPFSRREFAVAFFGFCGLSILLAIYLIDRQLTVLRLRSQIREDQRRALAMQEQTSTELFKALPNFNSFQDQLSMEYRRAATSGQELSLLVVTIQLRENLHVSTTRNVLLGDAAKAILRKLGKQDSFHLLQPDCFGIILPGAEMSDAVRIASRFAEGLADAAGIYKRFTFETGIVNYPKHAGCAQEMENAVRALLPEDQSKTEEGRARSSCLVFTKTRSQRGHRA